MGSGAGGIIDILFLASGIYLIYTAALAKKKGNIAGNVMLGKDMSENDIQDKAGFIGYMYKRVVLAGVMIVIAGIVHLANDYYIRSAALTWIGILIVLAALVLYTVSCLRGRKRYIRISQKGGKKGRP